MSPEELREKIASIDLAAAVDKKENIQNVLRDVLRTAQLSPELARDAEERIADLERSGVPINPLEMDVPLQNHPLIQGELQQARMHLVGDLARLTEAKVGAVLARSPSVIALSDAALQSLVEAGELEESEAKELGLTANLYQLADENINFTASLKNESFAKLGGRQVREIRDFAAFEADDWLAVIGSAKVEPPSKMAPGDYATLLAKRVATLYPTDALLARLKPIEIKTLVSSLQQVQPLFARNASVFKERDFSRLSTEGLSNAEVEMLRGEHAQLQRFANRSPGLGITELMDDPQLSPSEKASHIAERIGLLTRVQEQNPQVEFLTLDYAPESADVAALSLAGLSDNDRRMVLANWKACQRTYLLTKDVDHSMTMLEAGFDSATSLVQGGFDAFVQTTGFNLDIASAYYQSANNTVGKVTTGVGAILDVLFGGFSWVGVGNILEPATKDYLKKLDGFADLFGSQAYCQCKQCQSILSPAADFVDLMLFVENNILKSTFIDTNKQDHPLNLKVRRPDLWTLELTCQNTNELTPTLDIINEILENYIANDIAKIPGKSFNLPDRVEVEKHVYQELSMRNKSFQQPFFLPLAKLQTYLEHFQRTRADVARLLEADAAVITSVALKISKPECDLISKANTDLSFLQDLYDIPFLLQSGTTKVEAFDAQLLLKPMGLSREKLAELIETQFVKAGGQDVTIVMEKKDKESVQNDIERIYNLTVDSVDRMHRFTRLWRTLSWLIGELDLVLTHLKDTNLAQVDTLATVLYVQERLDVSVEPLCALWSEIPSAVLAGQKYSLFDRLFNRPPFLKLGKLDPNKPTTFIHPSFLGLGTQPSQAGAQAPTDDPLVARLRAGLNVSDEELCQLIKYLSKPLKLDLTGKNPKFEFLLDLQSLTLLYRHALLAKQLRLSISDLFQLVELANISEEYVQNVADLHKLLEFCDWWKTSGYSLDDLGFIANKTVQKPDTYLDKKKIMQQMLDVVKAEKPLDFADTVFALLPGVTEEQSRKIIGAKANSAFFAKETKPERTTYRLSGAFGSKTLLTIPNEIIVSVAKAKTVKEADAKAILDTALLKYHVSEVIPVRLAAALKLSVDKTKALISMTGMDLNDPEFKLALEEDDSLEKLASLVEIVLPLSVLFRKDVFDAEALNFILGHKDVFSIKDFKSLEVAHVRMLSIYSTITDTSEEAKFSTNEPGFTAADVQVALIALNSGKTFTSDDEKALAKVLRAEVGLASTLKTNILPPKTTPIKTAPEALQKLIRCAELAKYLGVGGGRSS